MAYRVEFRPKAENDLETLFRHLVQETPLHAPQWVSGLEDAIYALREMPERCPVLRQFSRPTIAVRQLLYGRYPHVYKIYFTIEARTIWILHIRHSARRDPKRRELFE
jgi:plasmid stabilization system protein ParE